MNIKLSIVDDHPIVREGLKKVILNMPQILLLHVCASGEALLEQLANHPPLPDIILMDIQMPGRRGVEITRVITDKYKGIAIIALTNLAETFHIDNMLSNGAKGYLLKSATPETIHNAILSVHAGIQFIDPDLKDQMLQDMLEEKKKHLATPQLTRRELEILQLIANGMTSQQIADQLFISYRTVENHRVNLFLKLNVKNAVSLVRKAIELNLVT